MQFKVPQFLDIEDKIFGPFTFRQFVYLAGGAGICYVLFKVLGFLIGIIPILLIAGFALALAFYRPNGKPFIDMLEAGFKYMIQDKLYVWERRRFTEENKKNTIDKKIKIQTVADAKLNGEKLKDLAWSLDILDYKK